MLQTLLFLIIGSLGILGIGKKLSNTCFDGTGVQLTLSCQCNGIITMLQFSTKRINLTLYGCQTLIKL